MPEDLEKHSHSEFLKRVHDNGDNYSPEIDKLVHHTMNIERTGKRKES